MGNIATIPRAVDKSESTEESLSVTIKSLTSKQALFVKGFFKNKGNATRAAEGIVEVGRNGGKGSDSLFRASGSEYLSIPNVKKTINGLLALNAGAESVTSWFNAQRFDDSNLNIAFKSNEALAKMLGLFQAPNARAHNGSTVNVVISLPNTEKIQKHNVQDIEFKAKVSE
jgi:hypothetical protein